MIREFIDEVIAKRDQLKRDHDPMAAGVNLVVGMLVGLAENLPRREVMAFAQAMEEKLCENEDKGHWSDEEDKWLLERLDEEKQELIEALGGPDRHRRKGKQRILGEAADVANFAMFLADNHGALGE